MKLIMENWRSFQEETNKKLLMELPQEFIHPDSGDAGTPGFAGYTRYNLKKFQETGKEIYLKKAYEGIEQMKQLADGQAFLADMIMLIGSFGTSTVAKAALTKALPEGGKEAVEQLAKQTIKKQIKKAPEFGKNIKFHGPRTPGFNPTTVTQAELHAAQVARNTPRQLLTPRQKDILDVLDWAPGRLGPPRPRSQTVSSLVSGTHFGAKQGYRSAHWYATKYPRQFRRAEDARKWIADRILKGIPPGYMQGL